MTATGTGSNLNLTILQANIPSSTTTYKVVATSASGCTTIDLTDQPTLTVYNTPAPTGSTSQSFCSSSTPRISNISVTGTGIIWYNAASGGSVLSSTTLLVTGTTYYASQTLNGCESQDRLAVTVTVTQTPTILTVTHGDICGSGSTTLYASSSSGTIHWYSDQTGGTDLGTGTSFTTPTISTTTSYWVSATNNDCTTLTRSEVIARVYSIPSVTLGSNPVACNGATSADLTYSSPVGSPNRYSINFDGTAEGQGFADVTDATLSSSPIVITIPGAASAGIYNATISFKNSTNGCISPDYPITVTLSANTAITSQPVAPSAVCEGNGVVTISVVASGGNLTYQWYVDGTTPLTETAPYSDVTSATLTITDPAISLNGKQYTVKVQGSCGPEVTSDAVALTVTATPSAPTGSASQSFCSADSPTLDDISITGTGIIWYDAASDGNVLEGSTSLVDGTTYYASQTVNSCESTERLAVTVTINDSPSTALAVSDADICNPASGDVLITITNAEDGVSYELQTLAGASLSPAVTGTGAGADLNLSILQADAPTTTTTYKVVASIAGCSAVDLSDQPTVVVDSTPPTISNCPSDITVNVDPGLCSAVVSWTAPTADDNCGIASFTSTHSPGATFATGTTTVTYTATDTNGNTNTVPCSFTVTVNDNIDPVINNCPSNTTVSTLNDIPAAETTAAGIGATDNCGVSAVTHADVSSLSCPRTITRTYTVTDINGRQTTCDQIITVTNAPCIDASLCTTTTSTNLVSGSPSSGTGTLYSQSVAVCSNTTYEIKLTGVSGTAPFDFDVILDGDYVNDDDMYNSGSTYGFKFKTGPSATSVNLSMVNNDAKLTDEFLPIGLCPLRPPQFPLTLPLNPNVQGNWQK